MKLSFFRLPALFLVAWTSFTFIAYGQSPSNKVQMDPDWEKIRDAQVQMLRRKEAELDRIKEELLLRAQPQARSQSGLPEIEAEIKRREVEWLQKSHRDENEITLLKIKVGEQKKEIQSLRLQWDEIRKKQFSVAPPENILNSKATQINTDQISVLSKEIKRVEVQLHGKSQELAEKESAFFNLQKKKAGLDLENKKLAAEIHKLKSERESLGIEKQTMLLRHKKEKDFFEAEKKRAMAEIERLEDALRVQGDDFALKVSSWEKGEKDWKVAQSRSAEEMVGLRGHLESIQVDLNQKDVVWKNQVEALSQKLAQTEKKLTETDMKLRQMTQQVTGADVARGKEWEQKMAQLENQRKDLNVFEIQLKNKNSDLLARALQLEDRSKALNQEHAQLEARAKVFASQSFSARSHQEGSAGESREISDLRQKLEQSKFENQRWQDEKWKIEKSWGDFVSEKTQYEMEIAYLQKQNQILQQKIVREKPASAQIVKSRRKLV